MGALAPPPDCVYLNSVSGVSYLGLFMATKRTFHVSLLT